MKGLIVYYSRTGTTKKVAETISDLLKCECEEIRDTRKRSGPFGFLISGFEAITKKLPEILAIKNDPGLFDLIIVGTPVWANRMSSPVRTYINKYRKLFKDVAFFATKGDKKPTKAFSEMEEVYGKSPRAVFELRTKEVNDKKTFQNESIKLIKDFIQRLKA